MPWVKSNLGCIALALTLHTQTALGQGDLLGTDEMAEAIVAMTSPVWTGPRTPAPDPVPRPVQAELVSRSPYALLAVHADPGVSYETSQRVRWALEQARARLDALGWPQPVSDGDLGGGSELDLYLTSALPSGAYSDGIVPWTYLDRASVFAVLGPAVPDSLIDACVTEAYAEAMLLSADPAEAEAWRRATAAWLTWELTGRFGCDDAVYEQQAEPFRSWVEGATGRGAGGAMWLAYLSARHDGDGGQFVRDLWALATQRTWEGVGLRADPDLWSSTETAVERSGDRLLDNIEDLAVLRWFVGRNERDDWPLAALDGDARVPIDKAVTRTPSKVSARTPLQAFGSAYVVMDAPAWRDAKVLRAWLQGEYGVRWSLVAVQLDVGGSEIRRIAAPPTAVTPRAYVPLELDQKTTRILFVVTNLSSRLPDADEPDANERAFELVVDRAD
ncbi:MAG: hypothetical protein AMJ63_11370 [Myxococcales bacterium SG8_38_1]|jgi:hypothetical protein|nr:MAG: hypothetical protein AMJ63_11370 [Myxococcales bacterium SG8_38_1]